MLQAIGISKQFSGVKALNGVSLTLEPGKVTAITGENGAGKSTLMKILSGVHTSYEGEIMLHGERVRFSSPKEAEKKGIAIIHQELNLVPYLSIAENIFLGREILYPWGTLNTRAMNQVASALLLRLNLQVDPATKVKAIKVGQQQLVEIAKALHARASVIIMDEPTSAISDKEVAQLFTIIRQLKAEGCAIAYISHKLDELFTIADKFVVLRDGVSVDSGDMHSISHRELIHRMTGREMTTRKEVGTADKSTILLNVQQFSMRHPELKNKKLLEEISFSLYKGEILGIYGLMGAGRTELMEGIFGLHPGLCSGSIHVEGKSVKMNCPGEAIRAGIALVPEDRKSQGLVLNQSVKKNITLTVLNKVSRWNWMLSERKEQNCCAEYAKRLSIKMNSPNHLAEQLSGGNQQKIVISKWLATHPKILLMDEPTRGIDIRAKAEIYALMKSLSAEGMGIIMVSSELPEILAVSDRVLVLCEGTLTANIPAEKATEQQILQHAIQKC